MSQTLMLHSLGFVSGDPTIRIGYPFVFHPGVQVTVTEPGDAKWVYMMLPIPKGSLITEVKVAYHRTDILSHITHIRLVEQREPVAAEVLHDEKITNTIPSIGEIKSECHVTVKRSMILKICMAFTSTEAMIEFGGVEVEYVPVNKQQNLSEDDVDKKRKEEILIYKFNKKQSINDNQPTLVDLFFQTRKKKTISNK
ncbi:MAG: hypothetical protein LLF80_04340 [Porphyromonadaceae bacterium]|nr:hypothetical protein [Porphyromonadaceae bacterium]